MGTPDHQAPPLTVRGSLVLGGNAVPLALRRYLSRFAVSYGSCHIIVEYTGWAKKSKPKTHDHNYVKS